MEQFSLSSCVRGYHIYKAIWNPSIGDNFNCEREEGNSEDPYAVAVMYNDAMFPEWYQHTKQKMVWWLPRNYDAIGYKP